MPRTKALMKKRAGAGAGSKKIVIKPFRKPPALPAKYYETTSQALLQGTMDIVFAPSSLESSSTSLSLQNAYQQVVNLVSHQLGPRLYRDLVDHFKKACEVHVLPQDRTSLLENDDTLLLPYVQTQYQKYVEYLLLCKHVFLPLDRTHAWMADGTVIKRSASMASSIETSNAPAVSAAVATTTATAAAPKMASASGNSGYHSSAGVNSMMGLWQVGLEQFRIRLQECQLDHLVYQKWWETLQLDWKDPLALGVENQALLQQTVYMWQDVTVLYETLSKKLEPDLIRFFKTKSQELKSAFSKENDDRYHATSVIGYCHSKWMHVAYHWSRFLPKQICMKLLEQYLFQPHLTSEWLLAPDNFDPLVEDAFASSGVPMTPPTRATNASSTLGTIASATATPIQQLWMLTSRLKGGHKLVGGAIAQYARTRGETLTKAIGTGGGTSNVVLGKQKIAELLALQAQLQDLLGQLPHASDHCALKNVWEDVVNPTTSSGSDGQGTNAVAEALAKYVDARLKDTKDQSYAGSNNNNNWSNNIISGIFCYLQAKDVFEAFYKHDLAKRLLNNRVKSMDTERHFVSLLKAECGAGYTAKMEGMFQDMDWSRETMNLYKQTDYKKGPYRGDQLDMDIQVLTTGYWPVYPQFPNLILPPAFVAPQEHFSEYYKTKYQGRRMTWQYALGHVNVRFRAGGGRMYDLVVSLCQALILLQFNGDEPLKVGQLMRAIGLEDRGEMERLLQSLSLGKDGTRVLQKLDHDADPNKKKKIRMNVHDDDMFRVQANFKSNLRRIRINNIAMKETKDDREKTLKAVSQDRLYLIDAVLVRIMKARKTILHQQLIPQVMEQVKVPAQPADIKKRIESLVEREYMERDAKDRNRYNYLA